MSETTRRLVTLSDERSLTVGRLRWRAYKALKAEVLAFVSGDLSGLVEGGQVDTLRAAAVLDRIGAAVDSLNEDFVRGCVTNEGQFDEFAATLTLGDMAALYEAALELNPVEGILDLEKNSPAGSLVRRSGLLDAAPLRATGGDAGGSGSSASSYDPAGEPPTSTD